MRDDEAKIRDVPGNTGRLVTLLCAIAFESLGLQTLFLMCRWCLKYLGQVLVSRSLDQGHRTKGQMSYLNTFMCVLLSVKGSLLLYMVAKKLQTWNLVCTCSLAQQWCPCIVFLILLLALKEKWLKAIINAVDMWNEIISKLFQPSFMSVWNNSFISALDVVTCEMKHWNNFRIVSK